MDRCVVNAEFRTHMTASVPDMWKDTLERKKARGLKRTLRCVNVFSLVGRISELCLSVFQHTPVGLCHLCPQDSCLRLSRDLSQPGNVV